MNERHHALRHAAALRPMCHGARVPWSARCSRVCAHPPRRSVQALIDWCQGSSSSLRSFSDVRVRLALTREVYVSCSKL